MININNLRFDDNAIEINTSIGKSVRVFPFKLVNGITNLTNNGERNWNVIVNDYTTFSMVLNGKESITAIWENSTRAYKTGKKKFWKRINKNIEIPELQKEYKVGKEYKGYTLSSSASLSIVPLNEFTSLEHNQQITILFNKDAIKEGDNSIIWDIQNQDLYNLYVAPELGNYQWMQISQVNKYYSIKGELVQVEITFETIGTTWSQTGGVKRQYINSSSAGEGYAFPEINKETNETQLDLARLTDTPITSIQVKCDGAAGNQTIWFQGRPVYRDNITEINETGLQVGKILPPRRIIASKVLGSIPNKVSLEGIATDDYYFVHNSKPVLGEIYTDWKNKIGDTFNSNQTGNFEGGFSIGDKANIAIIEATNPTPTLNSKYPNSQKGNPSIYIDQEYEIGTSGLLDMTDDRRLKLKGYYKYNDIINHMGFISDETIRVPNSLRNNTVWSLSRLPVIGGFLNGIVQGADFGWNQVDTILPTPPIGMFFPCEYLDIVKLLGTDTQNFIPTELFKFGVETSLTQLAGIGNLITSWRAQLSDQFIDNKGANNTVYLGQKKDETGKAINVLWNKDCIALEKNDNRVIDEKKECLGYIIDYSNIKIFYEGDYTLTFFNDSLVDENNQPIPVAEWRFSSKGKNTNCIREWNNEFKLSAWIDGFTTEGSFKWPEAVQLPPPTASVIRNDINIYDSSSNINCINNMEFDWANATEDLKEHGTFYAPWSTSKALGTNWNDPLAFLIDIPTWNNQIADIDLFNNKRGTIQRTISNNILDLANSLIIPAEQKTTIEELLADFKNVEIVFDIKPITTASFNLNENLPEIKRNISIKIPADKFLNNDWTDIDVNGQTMSVMNTASRKMTLDIFIVVPNTVHYGIAHNVKIENIIFDKKTNKLNFLTNSYNIGNKHLGAINTDYYNQKYKYDVFVSAIKLQKE